MKVYLGPYKNWFGPYQLAEKLCFWVKNEKDDFGFPKKPDWVHSFGHFLAHGEIEKDDSFDFSNDTKHKTWLYKFLVWIDSKRNRTEYIKIDKWDTWNMDDTLAKIALPMLKQLKSVKHGAPYVDDDDVPEELKSTSAPPKENDYDIDDNHFKRWDWVLNEMIFAFEHIVDDSWEQEYHKGEFDFRSEPCEWDENGKPKLYTMIKGSNHTHECDYDAIQKVNDRIDNGLKLFGKYYRSLWD